MDLSRFSPSFGFVFVGELVSGGGKGMGAAPPAPSWYLHPNFQILD
jgi:hypothetical protein